MPARYREKVQRQLLIPFLKNIQEKGSDNLSFKYFYSFEPFATFRLSQQSNINEYEKILRKLWFDFSQVEFKFCTDNDLQNPSFKSASGS